jgi:hypothetical protein
MLPPVDELTVDYGPPPRSLAPPRVPEVTVTGDIAPPRSGTRHKKPSASEPRLPKRTKIESEPALSEQRSRRPKTPVPATFRPDPRKTRWSVSLAAVAAVVGAVVGTGLGQERLAEIMSSTSEPPTTSGVSPTSVAAAAPGPDECTTAPVPTAERSDAPVERSDVLTMRFEDLPLAERDERDPNDKRSVRRRSPARNAAKQRP